MTAPSTMLSETHERFFKAIVAKLPVERIIELHLFPSIRQGGVESGVAVVAAVPEGELATPVSVEAIGAEEETAGDRLGGQAPGTGSGDRAGGQAPGTGSGDRAGSPTPVPDPEAEIEDEPPLQEVHLEALVSDEEACIPPLAPDHVETAVEERAREDLEAETAAMHAGLDAGDEERLEEAVLAITDDVEDPAARAMAAASLEIADLPPTDERPRRYTIWSARYRHVLKGPDRGKWDVSVVAEADAPLVTAETVVRGVQRRSGELEEVGRWTGEELRAALRL